MLVGEIAVTGEHLRITKTNERRVALHTALLGATAQSREKSSKSPPSESYSKVFILQVLLCLF